MKRYHLFFAGFTILLFLGAGSTLIQGETPWSTVWQETWLRIDGTSQRWNPLLDERLPRLIILICTGASLAVSGAVMQALFQNSLASPSVLGISSGGCLAVVSVFIFNWHQNYPQALPFAAFLGCLAALCLVYSLSKAQPGAQLSNLILTGIAVSTLIIAIEGVVLYALRHNWQLIQTISEWQAGSTVDRSWEQVHMQLPLTLVGLWGCWIYRRELNILSLGDEEASNLGVDVKEVRWRLFLCIALLTGGSLAAVGVIAFYGLVIPHIIRRAYGPDHLFLIPLCMVGGAAILIAIDQFLRLVDFHTVSIGNFAAIAGGVFFLLLLFRPAKRLEWQEGG